MLSAYFLAVSCYKRMRLTTRKFNRSTEMSPLDQTCQLSLTLEIKLPEFIEGVTTHVLQSSYWQPVSVRFNPQYFVLDFYTWICGCKIGEYHRRKAFEHFASISDIAYVIICVPIAKMHYSSQACKTMICTVSQESFIEYLQVHIFTTSVMIIVGASLSDQHTDLLSCHYTKQDLSGTSRYPGIT